MLHQFILIPVTLWLLLPPGICVCHGLGNLLPIFASETTAAPDFGPICEDAEHVPWCPEHKMTYHHASSEPFGPSLAEGLVIVLPSVLPVSSGQTTAFCPLVSTAQPADSPLYLDLCALRI